MHLRAARLGAALQLVELAEQLAAGIEPGGRLARRALPGRRPGSRRRRDRRSGRTARGRCRGSPRSGRAAGRRRCCRSAPGRMTLAGRSLFGPKTREITLPTCGLTLSALKSCPVIIQRWPFSCVAPVRWCRLRISATLSIMRRHQREVLADLDAGDVGRDRLELAAHLGRGVGLHVPGIELAGRADQEDRDAIADIAAADRSTAPAASSRIRLGSIIPARPAEPTCRKLRRVTPLQTGTFTLPTFSMEASPSGWRGRRRRRGQIV